MVHLAGGILTLLLYVLTILTTLFMLSVVPTALFSVAIGHFRGKRNTRAILVLLCFPLAYVLGGLVGWTFRPFGWSMSFPDTLRANFADHSIEYYAERVLLFVLLTGSAGAWLCGIAVGVGAKWRSRMGREHPCQTS